MPVYHILNGDALLERIKPLKLPGRMLVMRECLMDGPVIAGDLDSFIEVRAEFIASHFNSSKEEYLRKSASQVQSIADLPPAAECMLWFEDDLFCQANLWFVVHTLRQGDASRKISLVRPNTESWHGFGGMSLDDLAQAYEQRVLLTEDQLLAFSNLWNAYADKDDATLRIQARALKGLVPRLPEVIEAEIDRRSDAGGLGRPQRLLRDLKERHPEMAFGPLFRAFSGEAGIYGFGDLQVRRMLEVLGG